MPQINHNKTLLEIFLKFYLIKNFTHKKSLSTHLTYDCILIEDMLFCYSNYPLLFFLMCIFCLVLLKVYCKLRPNIKTSFAYILDG